MIDAALDLAERQGWRRTGLAEIAAEAGLSLAEVYALHRGKAGILRAFQRRADQAALAASGRHAGESARERLFDVLMRRLDVLKPHKAAIRAIVRDSFGDPVAILGIAGLTRSMRWMLEGAGISTGGCAGRLLAHLTAALYLSVLRIFLADDSEDLGRTMAALDRGLRQGERICRFLPGRGRLAAKAA
ncbi:MAG TPA: helix-turn-helix domain-containing protein [Stellaceae bacterium]|nr:helix-turn-helix domain-containing protein [Stellaceae bacterium]